MELNSSLQSVQKNTSKKTFGNLFLSNTLKAFVFISGVIISYSALLSLLLIIGTSSIGFHDFTLPIIIGLLFIPFTVLLSIGLVGSNKIAIFSFFFISIIGMIPIVNYFTRLGPGIICVSEKGDCNGGWNDIIHLSYLVVTVLLIIYCLNNLKLKVKVKKYIN
jgi:hypothetical protein